MSTYPRKPDWGAYTESVTPSVLLRSGNRAYMRGLLSSVGEEDTQQADLVATILDIDAMSGAALDKEGDRINLPRRGLDDRWYAHLLRGARAAGIRRYVECVARGDGRGPVRRPAVRLADPWLGARLLRRDLPQHSARGLRQRAGGRPAQGYAAGVSVDRGAWRVLYRRLGCPVMGVGYMVHDGYRRLINAEAIHRI